MQSKEEKNKNAAEKDRNKVKERLEGFDIKNSAAMRYLASNFNEDLKHHQLFQLAEYLVHINRKLSLDREAKRRKAVLIKWFDDNLEIIKPMLDNIVFEDEDKKFYGKNKDDPRLQVGNL